MIIREYKDSDYQTLLRWYFLREENPPPQYAIPKTGYVVEDVCAGFLYVTDSKIAIIDLYISNPGEPDCIRNKGLDLLTTTLLGEAKKYGCMGILATTSIEKVKGRAKKHGFMYRGDTSIYFKEI